ncbi:kinase-like protein [Gigaspora margarita]|uniref:Kinase-like protein n=1 Tax=Gigaspora margarita TaxID=4874 RepID=A0A8H3X8I5_GIGMA|nr:kinase-like protein [Gigaspora margarita]
MIQQFKNDAFLEQFCSYNSFEMVETYNPTFSSDSCKVYSTKYNKNIIINKITFSQKYTLENFVRDLKQYQKIESHENILKFLAIVKHAISEVIYVHEYALNGTLHPQYLQNLETYKLNKSSDIYSIGVLLWEISSGTIPFKTELPYRHDLLNAIIHGKREVAISGTPIKFIEIYTECWKNDSNKRPVIQHIFKKLNNINYDRKEIFIEYDNVDKNKDQLVSKKNNLNEIDLLIHYTNVHNEIAKELDLISSIIVFFIDKNNLLDNQINSLNFKSSLSTMTKLFSQVNTNKHDEQNFLHN